jgi:N-acetylglucosamine-6-phosphate deacetylase
MIDLVRTMVREVNVPLHDAIAMATRNPARVIGLKNKGSLRVGLDADFVVLSRQLDPVRTFACGEEIWSAH